jgi:hypothetical protein
MQSTAQSRMGVDLSLLLELGLLMIVVGPVLLNAVAFIALAKARNWLQNYMAGVTNVANTTDLIVFGNS